MTCISDVRVSPPHGHVILLANPILELWDHIRFSKTPSISLIIRVAKVAVLAIFKWHGYDSILFPKGQKFYHNINGKFCCNNKEQGIFYDHIILRNAKKLKLIIKDFSFPDEEIDSKYFNHKGISARSIIEYYRDRKNIEIVPKKSFYSVWDLLHSDKFVDITDTFKCPSVLY